MIAYVSTSIIFNWRIAFWVGAIIALVGLIARTRLRETPEFADYKRRLKLKQKIIALDIVRPKENTDRIDKKAVLSYFTSTLIIPLSFYISFIYTAPLMKESLGMTGEKIISQNLKINILWVAALIAVVPFIKRYHPVILTKINIICSTVVLCFVPYWLGNVTNILSLTLLQMAILSLSFTSDGIEVSCFKHISLVRRFTILAVAFGTSAAVVFSIVPFSLVFLNAPLGYCSLLVIYIPIIVLYWYSIWYIKKLEIQRGLYYNYPDVDHLDDGAQTGEQSSKK